MAKLTWYNGKLFEFETEDEVQLTQSNVKRNLELKISNVKSSSTAFLLVELYANDGRYELMPLTKEAALLLRNALIVVLGNE